MTLHKLRLRSETEFFNNILQVVVLASLAQLLVFVELARCARSVQIQIKHVICMWFVGL